MSVHGIGQHELLYIAIQTLGYSHTNYAHINLIPPAYLNELKEFYEKFPNDIRFRFTPEPGVGLGYVICLEDGCQGEKTSLWPRGGADRNGVVEGVGALRAHRVHVLKASHIYARNVRMNRHKSAQKLDAPSSGSQQMSSNLLGKLDQSFGSSSPSLASRPRTAAGQSENVNPNIPLKRESTASSAENASKRVKLEEPPSAMHLSRRTLSDTSNFATQRGSPLSTSHLSTSHPSVKQEHQLHEALEYKPEVSHLHASKAQENGHPSYSASAAAGQAIHASNVGTQETAVFHNSTSATMQLYGGNRFMEAPEDDIMQRAIDRLANINQPLSYKQSNPEEMGEFFQNAGNKDVFDANQTVDNALQSLNIHHLGDLLPHMTVSLMPHQVIGVDWMLKKELDKKLKGGILADEMGLGKTVQMIGLMCMNLPKGKKSSPTLIVAPLALLHQWKMEIEDKTDGHFSCLIYHGPSKPKKAKDITRFDIILTTYQTMALEWPDPEALDKKRKSLEKKRHSRSDGFIDDDDEGPRMMKIKQQKEGPLIGIEFYRVVLDEAQFIRNPKTRASRAACELKSEYRWCLTGTPLTNNLIDGYSLIRFIQLRPWYDWTEFKNHIGDGKTAERATRRLQAIFAQCLMRRRKDSLLDGKPLITLPPKTITLHKLKFDEDERAVYNMVEQKAQEVFNKFLRAGTVLKNYNHVYTLLLRLRQVCNHPVLIHEHVDAFVNPEELRKLDHEVISEISRVGALMGEDFVHQQKKKLLDLALARMKLEKESHNATVEDDDDTCPICYDNFTDPVVTACGHYFCGPCIDNVLKGPEVDEPGFSKDERHCPSCRGPVKKSRLFERKAFEPTDEDLGISVPSGKTADLDMQDINKRIEARSRKTRAKAKGKKRARGFDGMAADDPDVEFDESDDSDDSWIVDDDHEDDDGDHKAIKTDIKPRIARRNIIQDSDDEGPAPSFTAPFAQRAKVTAERIQKTSDRFLPSTKMKFMMERLEQWAESHPDDKTIIISQWTSMLELVQDYCIEKGFVYTHYQGNMSFAERNESVRWFMKSSEATVMLLSLKAGGVGLNLTRANRTISLDLAWNMASESQAFDRVHRLGQTKPVEIERLVIENTVEDRILELQAQKSMLSDGALGEGNGVKLGKLTVNQLAGLFNLDRHGRPLRNY